MRYMPRSLNTDESIVIDFGPLSLVVQRTTAQEMRNFSFHYSEEERRVFIDWLYDIALGDEVTPFIANAYDATWSADIDTTQGAGNWFTLEGLTPGNPRHVEFCLSAREVGNLANSLNQTIVYTPNEYQRLTKTTANYYTCGLPPLVYTSLGLAGEAGELANKVKKIFRDGEGITTEEDVAMLMDEVGDCLWYCARLLDDLDVSLENTMKANTRKLQSRAMRGVISGSGDDR